MSALRVFQKDMQTLWGEYKKDDLLLKRMDLLALINIGVFLLSLLLIQLLKLEESPTNTASMVLPVFAAGLTIAYRRKFTNFLENVAIKKAQISKGKQKMSFEEYLKGLDSIDLKVAGLDIRDSWTNYIIIMGTLLFLYLVSVIYVLV